MIKPYKPDVIIDNAPSAFSSAPTTTGVYVYVSKHVPIYIGKAVHIRARLKSHAQSAQTDKKEAKIAEDADSVEIIFASNELEAILLEARLIRLIKPKYNVRWRDDKSYLYIKITKREEYPKVLLSRKEDDGNSAYFGPFSSSRQAEKLIKYMRRVIPFCTQKGLGNASCFYAKLGLCNPCPSYIRKQEGKEREHLKKIYKSHIKQIEKILSGKSDIIGKQIHAQIKMYSKKQEFEKALQLRKVLTHLELLISLKDLSFDDVFYESTGEKSMVDLFLLLKPLYHNLKSANRVECFDNSNLSFAYPVASMSVFVDGKVEKSQFRSFKLKSTTSDMHMMREIIKRRLAHTQWGIPDIIIIDGGRPQLKMAVKAFNEYFESEPKDYALWENTIFVGLAKRPDRFVINDQDLSTLRPRRDNLGFRLAQYARDEAHRFAKSFHTRLREAPPVIQ